MSVNNKGKISQIIGAVIDVTFEQESSIPNIYDALEITKEDGEVIVLECQQDIGENTIRTIAMDSTASGQQRWIPAKSSRLPEPEKSIRCGPDGKDAQRVAKLARQPTPSSPRLSGQPR